MSGFSTVLQPFWMRSLNSIGGNQEQAVKAWIASGALAFDHISPAGEWSFHAPDVRSLLRSFASDINRMSMASFESINGVPSSIELPRSTAWTLIRMYYAAFFAAHALLRVYGHSVLQLEKAQAASLTQAVRLGGHQGVIAQGLWLMSLDQTNHTFLLSPLTNGSHGDTWSIFGKRIKELSAAAGQSPLASPLERQLATLLLDDIEAILRTPPSHSAANWLSHMRNQLNYQHAYGAWYPHQRSSRFRDDLVALVPSWRSAPKVALPRTPHPLLRFAACNVAIIAWMRETIVRLADKHPDNDSFLEYGAIRVLNQCINRP